MSHQSDWASRSCRNRDVSLHHCVDAGIETHQTSRPVGTGAAISEIKRPNYERVQCCLCFPICFNSMCLNRRGTLQLTLCNCLHSRSPPHVIFKYSPRQFVVRHPQVIYEGVSKSFRFGRLERELQMVQLSATRYSCIVILWVSLASYAAITLCVASQQVFVVVIVVYFVINSVRKLLDILSYFPSRVTHLHLGPRLKICGAISLFLSVRS
jgi:hypothetical protein